ncbi:MAG: glycosyltransferase family A protein, partial [Actinomycetota bacterium]
MVLGGNPLRFLRLTEAGADALRRWLGGEAPGSSPGTVALARRLVDGGMVHPAPPAPHPDPPLTVIIPVKDDPDGLTATLATLADAAVIVVDDGSATPVGPLVADLAPSAHTIRRSVSGGPGVARQDGLAVAETELVAFVDAGVELDITDLRRLSGWFADPELVAVAPRVVAAAAEGPIAGYEQTASPLDLGPDPSPVGPGRSVSYLPTACLVARRGTVVAAG